MFKKIVKNKPLSGLLAFTASVLLTTGTQAIAQNNTYVNDFGTGGLGTDGWKSDDTRNAAGTNIIGGTNFANPGDTHAPGADTPGNNIYDPSALAAQIDWRNLYGSRGNLGFLNLTANVNGSTSFTAAQKSTMSVINSASGLGVAASALGEDFSATYRFNKGPNNAPAMGGGVALKIGVQSTAWVASQAGYAASRSGESSWDLILVHDPSFDGVTYGAAGLYTETVTQTQGVWKLFSQAGNTYWTTSGPGAPPGGGPAGKTLAEWAADEVWGPLLFGANANVSDVQFGVGSGNVGIDAGLDWAQVSFLNEGNTIDFVDATTWTGATDNEFGKATNWNDGVGPTPTNNVVFTGTVASPVTVSANTEARSIAVGNGTVSLAIADDTTLALKNDGFLSAEKNATLNLTGGANSLVTAAAVEAWGNVNLATKITLDGGSVDQPVRKGRYAIVVAEGGELTLENGADVTVGNASGAQGVKTLIRVGEMTAEGGVGIMNIEDGAHLTAGSTVGTGNWTGFHVGDWGGEGVVNQTGGTVDLFGGLVIGNEAAGTTSDLGSKGTYNLSGGTLNIYRPASDNGAVIVGRATTDKYAEGILNVSGGLLDLGVLGGAPGNVAMVVGGLSDNDSTYANAKGTVNQTGGIVRFTNGRLIFGRGQGIYNLSGGTLEIGGTNGISATPNGNYAFNFGGGTLKAISNLTTSINANVVGENKASYIDTNGKDITWNGDLTADGLHQFESGGTVLRKIGVGKLTFTTGTRKFDTFAVLQDRAGQTSGSTSAVEFMVGSGDGSTGTYLMDGGTLQINPSTKKVGGAAVSGSLRVGDFNGIGTFTQTAGNVILTPNSSLNVGNRGGKGTYDISGGTLQLSNALNVLGRNDPKDGTTDPSWAEDLGSSEGTLAISGDALVEVLTGGSLVLSSNSNTTIPGIARASKGTINQTGGTLRINNNASLFLGAAGDGEYNLNGGVLEIGGDSLKGVYNNIGGTYDFNLGGGTIKVIGSDLVTSVDADLTPGEVSTIDTGALNATWGGNLIGEGLHQVDFGGSALVKAGTGQLTFTGNTRTLDTFAVTAGKVRQTIGATSAVEMMVGTGAGSTGTYLMDGGTLQINPSTREDNTTPVSGSFRIGDFNGTGTFTQTAGDVILAPNSSLIVGNRGGKGTYDISGGTLQLSTTLNVLGRNDANDGAPTPEWATNLGPSEGALKITGTGLVELLSGSSLVLSSNSNTTTDPNTGRASKGTITQEGGTLRVNNGASLFLGAAGTGLYDLKGGTLEIGGNSLKGVYNNIGGSYAFNLGGGTIKAIGSKLVTDVDANLVAGKTSTIDTNNLGVDWSGNLTSDGLHQIDDGGSKLIKEGEGILAFTGTGLRKLDTFAVEGGGVRQAAGTTSAVELMVGTDPGNEGTYLMEAGDLNITAATNESGGAVSGSFRVGDFGGTGTFTQTGGNVTLGSDSALNIGNKGGQGVYNISGGKLTLTSINVMGRNTTSDLIASEGVLNISGDALVDMLTGSSWILSSNTSTDASSGAVAKASKGTINQSGGIFRFNNGSNLYLGAYGTGAYNLTGGTLEIGGTSLNGIYNNRGGSYSFKFGGGTLKVIGSDLNTSIDASISNNDQPAGATSYIDTNGFNATWAGNLAAAGLRQLDHGGSKLVKTGEGNLAFTGTTRVLDTFAVEGGSAQQTAGTTSAVEFMVGTGIGNEGSYLMDAGTLRIKPSVDAEGDAVSGTFRVGDFGGTGTFTQTGGDVILESNSALNIGNRGGNGTYGISGGSLTLSDSINVIGRNTGDDAVASTGVLEIAGTGLVEVQSEGSVILSSNEVTTNVNIAQASTGKIDQTGGTFRVNNDANLYLGGVGSGTYNLTGGVLEIGGDSLNGVYNEPINVGGSYTFNLDGGTIKVIGSDLNTDVDAKLKTADETSTIDTNGFDATFTGTISGPGNLTKVGVGELTVVQEASIGTLMVSAGSAAFNSDYTGVDVILNGGDADFKGFDNHVTGDVTVSDGSQLMGSLSADGTTTIEAGGTHQLCDESISNDTGSYLLKTDATLIFDLDGTDLTTARLTLPTITLKDDSWIVLHSTEALDMSKRIFLFNVGELGLLTIGSSVNIQGTGGIADYEFELRADGYVTITAVPEPSVMVLLAISLGFIVIFLMKKRRQA